jgi:phenylpropionate dioxygenase-like ring-hydroxylating dioxygenase large terminal subunit
MNLTPPPREHWYIAARSRDLGARPRPVTILGEHLVLFRTAEGRPAALADRCAHRNLALSRGRVVAGALECAYHGWRYDGSGACTLIPSLAEVPDRIAVPSHPTTEADGFVWAFMGRSAPARAPRPFPHLGERGWTTFVMQNRFEAGALACLENFLDCPHTAYVHQGWFRSARAKDVAARVSGTDDEVCVEFDEKPQRDSLVGRLLFPKGRALRHTDRFLMPATSRVDYNFGPDWHFIITSQCTPVTDQLTDVYTVVTFHARRIGPLVRLYFEPMCRRIIRQDLHVLKAQTEDIGRGGGPRFTSVASDLVGPQIARRWREPHAEPGVRDVVLRF